MGDDDIGGQRPDLRLRLRRPQSYALTLRGVVGFGLFVAYLWVYWDLYARFFNDTPQALRYWGAMAVCFILLGIGAWLFDRVWPPKRHRRAGAPPASARPGGSSASGRRTAARAPRTAVPTTAKRPPGDRAD